MFIAYAVVETEYWLLFAFDIYDSFSPLYENHWYFVIANWFYQNFKMTQEWNCHRNIVKGCTHIVNNFVMRLHRPWFLKVLLLYCHVGLLMEQAAECPNEL